MNQDETGEWRWVLPTLERLIVCAGSQVVHA